MTGFSNWLKKRGVKKKLADKWSTLSIICKFPSCLMGYDRRYSTAHGWLRLWHVSEPHVSSLSSWLCRWMRVTVEQGGSRGGLQGAWAEHTVCYPDMRMSGQLHGEEKKLPTGERCCCALGQHDKWAGKAAGGHKSISPLSSSLLRWILPYTSSCPVSF